MDLTSIALLLLWILVLALVLVVLALARQIGVLYERIAPAGALMINGALKAGDAAPRVEASSLTQDVLTIGKPDQLLFFLAPGCPICKSLLPVVKNLRQSAKGVDFIFVSDGETEQAHRQMVADEKLQAFHYVISEAVGRAYGVSKLPYAVLIDEQGAIASMGLVNTREHLESLFEAKRLGIESLQAYLHREQQRNTGQFVDAALPDRSSTQS
jgi:methylamine dehydrogenase accessory protein MauD